MRFMNGTWFLTGPSIRRLLARANASRRSRILYATSSRSAGCRRRPLMSNRTLNASTTFPWNFCLGVRWPTTLRTCCLIPWRNTPSKKKESTGLN